jgi:hypothetical protein
LTTQLGGLGSSSLIPEPLYPLSGVAVSGHLPRIGGVGDGQTVCQDLSHLCGSHHGALRLTRITAGSPHHRERTLGSLNGSCVPDVAARDLFAQDRDLVLGQNLAALLSK